MTEDIRNRFDYVKPELTALIHRMKEQGKLLVKSDTDKAGMETYLAFAVSVLTTALTLTVPPDCTKIVIEGITETEKALRRTEMVAS